MKLQLVCRFFCASIVLLLLNYCSAERYTKLNTTLGYITGITSTINGTQINKFLGVPYAKPPVGELRFSKPERFEYFGDLNATSFGNSCLQLEQQGDEDCLFLNIFSPANSDLKAVMVWIHGGSFLSGSSSEYPADALAAAENVVVVTINYRLNILGFLTTGDRIMPGNLGLWDQHLALKWVKENIADYGGDSNLITVFGESAGARVATFQMFSPQNDGSVFKRVIAESGSALSFTFLNRHPYEVANHVSELTDCPITDDFARCLRTKPADILLKATTGIARPFPFFPIVDGDFLPYDLGYLLNNFTLKGVTEDGKTSLGHFSDYDLLGGWNDQEGLIYMGRLDSMSKKIDGKNMSTGVSEEVLTATLKQYPFYKYQNSGNEENLTIEIFKDFYHTEPNVPLKNGRTEAEKRIVDYMNIAGDIVLKLPLIQTLQLHAAYSSKSTYSYEFSHKRSWPVPWYEGPDWLRVGADHTDEIPYVFGEPFLKERSFTTFTRANYKLEKQKIMKKYSQNERMQEQLEADLPEYSTYPFMKVNFTDAEKEFSKRIMSFWADFAKSGNPGPEFKQFDFPTDQTYTLLTENGEKMDTYPLNERQRFWSTIDAAITKTNMIGQSLAQTEKCNQDGEDKKQQYLSGLLSLTYEQVDIWLTTCFSLAIVLAVLSLLLLLIIGILKAKREYAPI